MKVRTVGMLAALGMTLTSLTVWSVTPPGAKTDVGSSIDDTELAPPDDPGVFAGASFSTGSVLRVEGRLGHARLSATQDNETFLFVDVQADSSAVASTPAPLNLAIVIDRSGSMKGKRLTNALDAARGMISRLRDGDVVSLVTYSTSTETVLPPTTVDAFSRTRALSALDGVTAQGDTCISCGIETAMQLLARRSGMVDRMLLLSDGEATAGVRDLDGFRRIAERCRGMGASISAIGVDVEYNERVMSALALESNGRHHFVDRPGDLARAFDAELDSLVKSVAKSSELSVELAPGVELVDVVDRAFRRDGSRLVVPLGAFSAGEAKTLLVELRLPRGADGERPVARVELGFDDLIGGGRGTERGELSALLVPTGEALSELDPLVSTRIERSETAGALREANELFQRGRAEEAQRRLSSRRAKLEQRSRVALDAAPADKSRALRRDFDDQALALGEAEAGFSAPPPAASPAAGAAPTARKSQAQVKQNAARATELAF